MQKISKMKQPFIFMWICVLMCGSIRSIAQEKALPSWVAMIDNPKVNYFVAVQTFSDYWKGKIKPIEEMDIKDLEALTAEEKAARKTYFENLTQTERAEFDILQYHYKRFKQWKKDVLPFVQEDGRILSNEERMAIWENSKP